MHKNQPHHLKKRKKYEFTTQAYKPFSPYITQLFGKLRIFLAKILKMSAITVVKSQHGDFILRGRIATDQNSN